MATELDLKDRKILSILDMDARLPLSIIAKKVGLSREVVHYRIKQLEKKGIIEGYYVVIDITKLGLMYCRMFFRYRNMTRKKEQELELFCNTHPHLTWLLYGEGMFDVAITAVGPDLETIERVYDELRFKFGEYLQNPYLTFAFRIYHYKHKYLYGANDTRELILGESSSKKITLDRFDYALIDALSANATLSLIALAQTLHTTAKRVAYRIKKLLDDQIILAFRAKINTRLLGYDRYKVFLSLQNFDLHAQKKLTTFLQHHPNVIYVTKPMGMHDLEFEVIVQNANHLHEIMIELRDTFPDIISYQTNLYYAEPILSYCPLEKQMR